MTRLTHPNTGFQREVRKVSVLFVKQVAQLQVSEISRLHFFLCPHGTYMLPVIIKASLRGISNDYPKNMLLWRYKKTINIFLLKKVPYL